MLKFKRKFRRQKVKHTTLDPTRNFSSKVKVKVTLNLEKVRQVQRGSTGTALLRGWVVNATPRPLCHWERQPVCIVQEAGWLLGPVWIGGENLAAPPPTGTRSPNRVARSESLHGLSYPGTLSSKVTAGFTADLLNSTPPFALSSQFHYSDGHQEASGEGQGVQTHRKENLHFVGCVLGTTTTGPG